MLHLFIAFRKNWHFGNIEIILLTVSWRFSDLLIWFAVYHLAFPLLLFPRLAFAVVIWLQVNVKLCFLPDLFYVQEEEEGSEDDSNVVHNDFAVTMKTGFSVRSFLDQLEDEADGFVSPVDDKTPSKSSQDLGLGNLHAASV